MYYHFYHDFNMFLIIFYLFMKFLICYQQHIILYVLIFVLVFLFCESYGFEKLDLGVLDPSIV